MTTLVMPIVVTFDELNPGEMSTYLGSPVVDPAYWIRAFIADPTPLKGFIPVGYTAKVAIPVNIDAPPVGSYVMNADAYVYHHPDGYITWAGNSNPQVISGGVPEPEYVFIIPNYAHYGSTLTPEDVTIGPVVCTVSADPFSTLSWTVLGTTTATVTGPHTAMILTGGNGNTDHRPLIAPIEQWPTRADLLDEYAPTPADRVTIAANVAPAPGEERVDAWVTLKIPSGYIEPNEMIYVWASDGLGTWGWADDVYLGDLLAERLSDGTWTCTGPWFQAWNESDDIAQAVEEWMGWVGFPTIVDDGTHVTIRYRLNGNSYGRTLALPDAWSPLPWLKPLTGGSIWGLSTYAMFPDGEIEVYRRANGEPPDTPSWPEDGVSTRRGFQSPRPPYDPAVDWWLATARTVTVGLVIGPLGFGPTFPTIDPPAGLSAAVRRRRRALALRRR